MRRAWRKGENAYPLIIMGSREPFAARLLGMAALWCYRHRSAFRPFTLTAAAIIAAGILHHQRDNSQWQGMILAMTVITVAVMSIPVKRLGRRPAGRRIATLLSQMWEELGIGRGIERAYAAVVITVTGGWLTAAVITGLSKTLLVIAGVSCALLGIPWWTHRRRREKVRVERIIVTWPWVAEHIGLPGSFITDVMVDTWGWTARVILKRGITSDQAIARTREIESGLGLRPGSVRVYADEDRADHFVMRVTEKDPHAVPIPWPGTAAGTTVSEPVSIGLSEVGRPVRALILRRNVLIGGTTGSGKSGVLNVIIAALAACADVALWGIDLKGGMELQPWAGCFEKLATTPEEADELIRAALTRLDERAARMAAEGKRLWKPSPADPALVIIVDEYAELPSQSHVRADSIARRGRAVAVNLIAATQRPTQAAMGKNTAVRSQMDVRICLRVRERRDTDLILGQGALAAGWHAHQLAKPGEFLLSDPEHSTSQRHRAYLLTDEEIARHADWCAPLRPHPTAAAPGTPRPALPSPQPSPAAASREGTDGLATPEAALWAALSSAGPQGVAVADLVQATGKGRTWVYDRLRRWARAGRVTQTARGHWRAAGPADPHPGG
jgi:S-DNA-T family DNA segregation ATPase FtsK/SpoIIIE